MNDFMAAEFILELQQLDKQFFLVLHSFNSEFLDRIMTVVTHRFTWIPFYLLVFIYLIRKLSRWKLYRILLMVVTMIIFSDQVSVMIKNYIQRPRPCYDQQIGHLVRPITGCGGKYGFFSSHASNTFALAIFFILLARTEKWPRYWTGVFLIYALLVSYSRIYVGVHYPVDILAGALFGTVLAFSMHLIYKKVTKSNLSRIAI